MLITSGFWICGLAASKAAKVMPCAPAIFVKVLPLTTVYVASVPLGAQVPQIGMLILSPIAITYVENIKSVIHTQSRREQVRGKKLTSGFLI